MALQLNTSPETYKEFYGKNVEQMPALIAEGRVPMNVSQLMQKRLDVRNSREAVKESWMDNYFDTGDTVAYHPDGRVKVVLDSQTLREMIPDTEIIGGALLLTGDAYNALEGEEFAKGKLGKIGSRLSKDEVKAHPVWKTLARDQGLLNDYADLIFTEGKERFDYDTVMGVYPDSVGEDPKMRAWLVGGLGYGSNAGGWSSLDFDVGRFAGLAPEALNVHGKGVDSIGRYTMADLQTLDKSIQGLEAVVRPKLLEGIKGFRQKL